MNNLLKQKCIPCEGTSASLSDEVIQNHLKEIDGWTLESKSINKKYLLVDFTSAMKFVNSIAALAEQEGHHPDISISYNKVDIKLWTHAIKGLSINDFIMAAKIDEIAKTAL